MPAPARTSTDEVVAAGRAIVERDGLDALTMQAVARAVGVRAPSLYKRVAGRDALVGLITDLVAVELTTELEKVVAGADPAADLRALTAAFRAFAGRNPATYRLLFDPRHGDVSPETRDRTVAAVRRVAGRLAGEDDELDASRMIVAWVSGFVAMELAGAFQLGGDVDQAWDYALNALVSALGRR